jgi:hydroxymethylpyrimidine pyrophosphatase-like HAD family hydrolase
MPIPKRNTGESKNDFINRCMSDSKMKSEFNDEQQRYAICSVNLAQEKISFDYDGTLSTKKGSDLAKELIADNTIYIISARSNKFGMISKAKELGIQLSRVYATGSNKEKIEKIKELGIDIHYDNNNDVVNELGNIGKLI